MSFTEKRASQFISPSLMEGKAIQLLPVPELQYKAVILFMEILPFQIRPGYIAQLHSSTGITLDCWAGKTHHLCTLCLLLSHMICVSTGIWPYISRIPPSPPPGLFSVWKNGHRVPPCSSFRDWKPILICFGSTFDTIQCWALAVFIRRNSLYTDTRQSWEKREVELKDLNGLNGPNTRNRNCYVR